MKAHLGYPGKPWWKREGGKEREERELERDHWQLKNLNQAYKKGREKNLRKLLEQNKGREAKNACFFGEFILMHRYFFLFQYSETEIKMYSTLDGRSPGVQ